jgi:hypothetical protein
VDNFVDISPAQAKILGKSRLSTRCLEKKQICIPIKIKYLAQLFGTGLAFVGNRQASVHVNNFCEQVLKIRQKPAKSC